MTCYSKSTSEMACLRAVCKTHSLLKDFFSVYSGHWSSQLGVWMEGPEPGRHLLGSHAQKEYMMLEIGGHSPIQEF